MIRQHRSTAFRTAARLSLAASVLLAPVATTAQQVSSGPATRLGISAPVPHGDRARSSDRPIRLGNDEEKSGTHWLRGGIIGGLILGTGMYLLIGASGEHYEARDSTYHWGNFVGWGVVGFLGGMLVGGQFSK